MWEYNKKHCHTAKAVPSGKLTKLFIFINILTFLLKNKVKIKIF